MHILVWKWDMKFWSCMVSFPGKFDDEFDMLDAVRTKVEESDDEMENLEPKAKRGRGRGSRGNGIFWVQAALAHWPHHCLYA